MLQIASVCRYAGWSLFTQFRLGHGIFNVAFVAVLYFIFSVWLRLRAGQAMNFLLAAISNCCAQALPSYLQIDLHKIV